METESYTGDNKGKRYDEGKNEFHLIPGDALRLIGQVYTAGAKKYEPYNWERGMAWSRCFNSLLRHLYAFWDGERNDGETGLHHMAHVAWNAIALLVYSVRGIGIDDRKGSYLSAQQNIKAASVEILPQDLLKGMRARNRIDGVIPVVGSKKSAMRCIHCPDKDAMVGKDICVECFAPVTPVKSCS